MKVPILNFNRTCALNRPIINKKLDRTVFKPAFDTYSFTSNKLSNYPEMISKCAREADISPELKDEIIAFVSTEGLFNTAYNYGAEGTLYTTDVSELLVKIPVVRNSGYFKDTPISKQDELNGVVLKNKDFAILRKIRGIDKSIANKTFLISNFYKAVCGLPQSAYDDFIDFIAQASIQGSFLDVVGNNIIIDTKNQSFKAIDLFDSPPDEGFEIIDEPASPSGYNIDIIGCLINSLAYNIDVIDCSGIRKDSDNDYLTPFLVKSSIALAKDCKNFPCFYYDFDNVDMIENYSVPSYKAKLLHLFSKLSLLHCKKMNLFMLGKTPADIELELQSDIKELIDYANSICPIDRYNLTIQELASLEDEIKQKLDELVRRS